MNLKLMKIVIADVDGDPYAGSFEVVAGTLTVSSAFSRKTTEAWGMDIIDLAKAMLRDRARRD